MLTHTYILLLIWIISVVKVMRIMTLHLKMCFMRCPLIKIVAMIKCCIVIARVPMMEIVMTSSSSLMLGILGVFRMVLIIMSAITSPMIVSAFIKVIMIFRMIIIVIASISIMISSASTSAFSIPTSTATLVLFLRKVRSTCHFIFF